MEEADTSSRFFDIYEKRDLNSALFSCSFLNLDALAPSSFLYDHGQLLRDKNALAFRAPHGYVVIG